MPPERPLLSKRERECLMLIAQGKDDYAVSVLLGISEHTARQHHPPGDEEVQRIDTYAGVRSRVARR